MTADPVHGALQQRIACGMPVRIVDGLEADDIDVRGGERAVHSPRPIDLMLKVLQACRAHPSSGERVGLGDGQLAEQPVVVVLGLRSVVSSLLTITDRLLAIYCAPPESTQGSTNAGATWAHFRGRMAPDPGRGSLAAVGRHEESHATARDACLRGETATRGRRGRTAGSVGWGRSSCIARLWAL
jgi:hypothetical protein